MKAPYHGCKGACHQGRKGCPHPLRCVDADPGLLGQVATIVLFGAIVFLLLGLLALSFHAIGQL